MRIRTIVLAGVLAVAVPGLVAAALLAGQNWHGWQRAERAATSVRAVSDAQRAQTVFALEQAAMLGAVATNGTDLPAWRAAAKANDERLDAARKSAAVAGLDPGAAVRAAEIAAGMRADFQRYLAAAPKDRDQTFNQHLLARRQEAGKLLSSLTAEAGRRVAAEAPGIALLVGIASELMDMRDYVGRRSLLLNSWMGGAAIAPAQMIAVDSLTGHVEQTWDSAERLIEAIPDAAALSQARSKVRDGFVRDTEPKLRGLIETARARLLTPSGTPPPAWPETLDNFRVWGPARQASIVELRDATLDLAVGNAAAQAEAARRQLIGTLALVALTAVTSVGAIVLLLRRVLAPLRHMTMAVGRIAADDLTVGIPGIGRRDEMGAMGHAMQVLRDNAIRARDLQREQAAARERRATEDERVRAQAAQAAAAQAASLVVGSIGAGLERLASGDLTYRVDSTLPPAYEKLRGDLNTTAGQLRDLVRGIVGTSGGIRSGTEEVAQAAENLSRRTESQAASLEETASALAAITATLGKTAEGAAQAHAIVAQTRTEAARSGEVVSRAVAAMGGIEQSSRQIGQIIGVIDEISFQTNLLALNAGVEAARAGDAGRGFAVVASEVRALAQRSAEAAREIKELVTTSSRQVGEGVKLVGETGTALERIVAQVGEITGVVSAIASSAQEQSTSLREVNAAVSQMDQMTQQNAAMVEQTTAASRSLAHETAELVGLTRRFTVGESSPSRARAFAKVG